MSSVSIGGQTGTGQRARLKAYSSFEPYELEDYRTALAEALPDVAIDIERMPTAVLTARLLAERAQPGADLVFGWADTASQTSGLEEITLDAAGGYRRPSGFATAFITDPTVLKACGVEAITKWSDLANPRLAGRLIFPDPAISGAGFLAVTTLVQFFGEQEGWSLIAAIVRNAAGFPGSAWQPAAMVGDGVTAVGVTVRIAVTKRLAEQANLVGVNPEDVVGVEAEVYGGLRATRHKEAVRDVVDWVLSDRARKLFAEHNKTDLGQANDRLFMIDAARAVADRNRLLAKFQDYRIAAQGGQK